jgi:hypothetical protein
MISRCDICRATLQEGDVHAEALYVKCSSCGSLYGLLRSDAEAHLAARGRSTASLPAPAGQEDAPPDPQSGPAQPGFDLVREGEILRLSWSWYAPHVWLLPILSFIFGLVGWAGLTTELKLKNGGTLPAWAAWALIAFCLLILYSFLMNLLNHTTIQASRRDGLQVRHGPVPTLIPSPRLEMRDIRQLYAKERQRRHKGHVSYTYELHVLLHDDTSRKLAEIGLKNAEQVLFLERTLEEHLGVKDRPIPGELKASGGRG